MEAGLLAAAVKQNVQGHMIQPLTTLQWVHIVALRAYPVPLLNWHGACHARCIISVASQAHMDPEEIFSWEVPKDRMKRGSQMVAAFNSIMSSYHEQISLEGVDATHQPVPCLCTRFNV